MFLEVNITMFDPQNRKLDLRTCMPLFLHSGIYPTEWIDSKSECIYVQCGEYFVLREMKKLGLKYISKDGTVENPIPDIDKLDLAYVSLFYVMAEQGGLKLTARDMLGLEEQKEITERLEKLV